MLEGEGRQAERNDMGKREYGERETYDFWRERVVP
jgi:hypothetical protein